MQTPMAVKWETGRAWAGEKIPSPGPAVRSWAGSEVPASRPLTSADPQTNIRRNHLRESCQNGPIAFPLSNGRSWPLMREGLWSGPRVQRLLLAPQLSFFLKQTNKKKIIMGKSHASKQFEIPRNWFRSLNRSFPSVPAALIPLLF